MNDILVLFIVIFGYGALVCAAFIICDKLVDKLLPYMQKKHIL